MDEMKIKISTKFMRGIVAKIASKVIANKLGIKADIQLNGISVEKINDKIHLHIDVDADIDETSLLKLTRLANLEEEA
jgi:hypothetical protein|nr:MAG TPA: hypothetical protein [Caudoviricetes sp.]